MSLTYVTAMLKIYDIEYNEKRNGKNLTDRLRHFQSLVETGVQLVVYVSAIYKDDVERVCKGFHIQGGGQVEGGYSCPSERGQGHLRVPDAHDGQGRVLA
jgi:hypothetical protein